MRKKLFRIAVLFGPLLAPLVMHAQDDGRSKKEQEKIQQKEVKEKKKKQADYEKEKRKTHLDNQDKATRKRIKQHDRRADKGGNGAHRDPFLKRLFTRKH